MPSTAHWRRWRLLSLLLLSAVLLVGTLPARASIPASFEAPTALPTLGTTSSYNALSTADRIVTAHETTPVAPGLTLDSIQQLEPAGWLCTHTLSVDLAAPGLSSDLIFPGTVAAAAPVSTMARQAGAVAAVNGDFFDIGNTGAPFGAAVRNGEMLKSPVFLGAAAAWSLTAGVDDAGIGRLVHSYLDGAVTLPGGNAPLQSVNSHQLVLDGIGLYTPVWSESEELVSIPGAALVRELIVIGGVVHAAVDRAPVGGRVVVSAPPAGGFVLVGREAGAAALAAFAPGAPIDVSFTLRNDAGADMRFAVGGNVVLVRDGLVNESLDNTQLAPRTAIGFSADGRRMLLVAIDGRQARSRGMTLARLGQFMQQQGAYNALNLDGGGSTAIVARRPGANEAELVNSPSDGVERADPNGVGLFAASGSGQPHGISVAPRLAFERSDRVFPGLSRTYAARGYDETYSPAPLQSVLWRTRPPRFGAFDGDRLVGGRPGFGTVTAQSDAAVGVAAIHVLGPLARLTTLPNRVSLTDGAQARFRLVGYDAEGYDAPIEPRDALLEYDPQVVAIEPTEQGDFLVTPLVETGATVLRLRVGEVETLLPVTVGLNTLPVDDFENPDQWFFSQARAAGALAGVPGRTGNALQLSYDFTGACPGCSLGTRAAYANYNLPAPYLALPGQPQRIGLWVRSADGRLPWLRINIRHAGNRNSDTTLNLTPGYQENVGTDWRYYETTVPAGLEYPLYFRRVYAVETSGARAYTGALSFDDLSVRVAPDLEVPVAPPPPEPIIIRNGALDPERWTFAVMADNQFVAAAPDSVEVQLTRQALRQIRAAAPDFLIINGDFVDVSLPENYDFARRLLAEELGYPNTPFPVIYIPGNHEREPITSGSLDNFIAAGLGPPRTTFDHKGVRFILLDSSNGFLRSDFAQLPWLEALLRDAESNPAIAHVAVLTHYPTNDPLPTDNSQLGDRLEVELVEQWLTAFRERSGKGVAYVAGHAHIAGYERVDGVPYLVLPSASKVPYGGPENGGFNGWLRFGVRPGAATAEWLRAESLPLLQSATLSMPAEIAAGTSVTVSAIGEQVRGRMILLRYPATVTWSASENVFIGSGQAAALAAKLPHVAAVFDPDTLTLQALRPGALSLAVVANGERAEATTVIR